jgi:hypothetical protein
MAQQLQLLTYLFKTNNMKQFVDNVKTSLFGAVAGLPVIWEGAEAGDWKMILAGIGMFLVGIFASDAKAEK